MGIKITVGLVTLVLVSVVLLAFHSHLLHSPQFNIAIRELHGLRNVPEAQILMKLKEVEDQDKNLVALDLDHFRRSIEFLPWVKSATVRRILPDKLVIEVQERVPIAFARMDHTTWLVDEDGILLESNKRERLSGFDFPVILGLESGFEQDVLARNQKRIALYKRFMTALDENGAGLSKDVSEVHLHDSDNVSVLLDEDTVLVHLGSEQLQQRFRRYLAMSREIKRKYPLLDSVDLRFENQLIVNAANEKITTSSSN